MIIRHFLLLLLVLLNLTGFVSPAEAPPAGDGTVTIGDETGGDITVSEGGDASGAEGGDTTVEGGDITIEGGDTVGDTTGSTGAEGDETGSADDGSKRDGDDAKSVEGDVPASVDGKSKNETVKEDDKKKKRKKKKPIPVRTQVLQVVESLPETYVFKNEIKALCDLITDEWLAKFAASPEFPEFATKLGVEEKDVCKAMLALVPKLPDLSFAQLLEAGAVLDVSSSLSQSSKEKPLFRALIGKLDSALSRGILDSRDHINTILTAKDTVSMPYRSVLMDINDIFSDMLDQDCVLSVYDGTEPKVQSCDRRSVYAAIAALLPKKWPQRTESPELLYFSILHSLEELAGDVLTSKDISPWRNSISKLLAECEEKTDGLPMVPELWMHRLRMLSAGLEDPEFGAVDSHPWYRSTPFVLVSCLLFAFFFALITTILYYTFFSGSKKNQTRRANVRNNNAGHQE